MKFTREIHGLFNEMEKKPLPSSAIALWLALMHINCKAGWVNEFPASSPVLRTKGGLAESTFKMARRSLVDKGYMEHRTKGNHPAIYLMNSMIKEDESWLGDKLDSSKIWIAGEGVKQNGGETIEICSDGFLEMKQKAKDNLKSKGEELNLSPAKGKDDVNKLLERYRKEQF